jgi:hypothetical protein
MNAFRFLLLVVLATLIAPNAAHTQLSGPSSTGTDFVVSFPSNYEDPTATWQYIRLYIAAESSTTVSVYVGTTLKTEIQTAANGVVTVDLTKTEAQTVVRQSTAPVPPDRIYIDRAIRVVADAPITLYGLNRTSYTSDGMLVLPVAALGRRYVVAAASDNAGVFGGNLPSQLVVSAPFDGTEVTIVPSDSTPTHPAAQSFTIHLDAGDVFSAMGGASGTDLTGTTITSTKPVAVTAGSACAFLPNASFVACDHLAEMLMPVEAWGTVYHAVPFATRLKGDFFRIFASASTTVWVNGVHLAALNGPGGAMGDGWVNYLPATRGQIEFTATKPITVMQYNNSQSYDGVPSDPFYTSLVPLEQYRTSYSFATPKAGDFESNYLSIVSDSVGYDQIEISHNGAAWQSLASIVAVTPRAFASTVGGRRYVGVSFAIAPGAYRLRGTLPFTGTLYGFSSYDSYGYPLGASVVDLASNDTIPPLFTRTQDSAGFVTCMVTDMPDDAAIRSNLATVTLLGAMDNYRINVTDFESGVDRQASYTLTVIDRTRDARAVVEAVDKAGNAAFDTVSYVGTGAPVIEVTDVDFGAVSVDAGEVVGQFTIYNRSDRAELRIAGMSLVGDTVFTITAPPVLPSVIAPGDSIVFGAGFDPNVAGAHNATLTVGTNAEGFDSVALFQGIGISASVVATDHDFGTIDLSLERARDGDVTLSNVGTQVVRLMGIDSLVGDVDAFEPPNGSLVTNLDLQPGASAIVPVRYRPVAAGRHTMRIYWRTEPAGAASFSTLRGIATGTSGVADGTGTHGALLLGLWPNPSAGRVELTFQGMAAPAVITLVGDDGATLARWSRPAGETHAELDLSGFPSGSFTVRISAGGVVDARRVVVIR